MSSSAPWISAAFESSTPVDVDLASESVSSLLQNLSVTESEKSVTASPSGGHLASFVLLVSGLQEALHDEAPLILDSGTAFGYGSGMNIDRTQVASGASFSVERAAWSSNNQTGKYSSRWGTHVALKYILHRADPKREAANWKQLLLEIRTLMHEPIRYHPNIVRLLGLSWDEAAGTGSPFPVLVFELSELGTLAHFQANSDDSLPIGTKKKLCWDVSKGLSILHACGIIHGDLKHENVLIFPKLSESGISYTAKIADFGGSVMDLQDDKRALQYRTPTFPYEAPEFYQQSDPSEEELKLTDVYSLGLLIWRTMMDGKNPFSCLRSNSQGSLTKSEIHDLKHSSDLLQRAKESLAKDKEKIGEEDLKIMVYVLENTIRENAGDRSLVKAIAGLQAKTILEIEDIIQKAAKANKDYELNVMKLGPGHRGITPDSIGIHSAKMGWNGGDYDYQNTGPGYRPVLSPPPPGNFFFDPQRLKHILDWDLQVAFVRDLEFTVATSSTRPATPTQVTPAVASFFSFQCYCHEFGTVFDPEKACKWLKSAALCDEECKESYYARAWCWRFHETFGVTLDVSSEKLRDWMYWAILHGHRRCISECVEIASKHGSISDLEEMQRWLETQELKDWKYWAALGHQRPIAGSGEIAPRYAGNPNLQEMQKWLEAKFKSTLLLDIAFGGVGMPFFVGWKLRRPYNLDDLPGLDRHIQEEMILRGITSVDDIVVNHRGDGLSHMAAAMGNTAALRHLVEKHGCDIDKANRTHNSETPLLSACRGGHLACALYLIDRGANPDGSMFSSETPLYWLCSFKDEEVLDIAARLVRAGASLKNPGDPHTGHPTARRTIRRAVRQQFVWADYENLLLLPASPLSRAVMMNSLPAVRALLALGADPLEGLHQKFHPEGSSVCPVIMASVLTLPEILEVMLSHLDAGTQAPARILSEIEMLRMAIQLKVTIADPVTLQSRITRLGAKYKSAMARTLQILHDREEMFVGNDSESARAAATKLSAEVMASLVLLGRYEIVENLLQLGHAINGIGYCSPIVEAVKLNHESLFHLLIRYEADYTALYDVVADDRQRSLLQIFAERSRQSRGDISIAKYLLDKGVPADPAKNGMQKPAFASAVSKQDFELADLLIAHGADVDFTYKIRAQDSNSITILAELMHKMREKNIDSIRYLLRLEKKPSFLVSPENSYTVFHYALAPLMTDVEKRIRAQILRLLLSDSTYCSDEVVYYSNPEKNVFPVMIAAALSGNLEIVTEFLDKGLGQKIMVYGGMNIIQCVETMIDQSQQFQHLFGKDRVTREVTTQRYRMVLNRLKETQASSETLISP